MCALDKNPKIPIEVNSASATTAGTRYRRNVQDARFQYLCSHTVVVTLATSSAPPMIIIGITAAAKIAVKPKIEYQAAMALRDNATIRVSVDKLNILRNETI